MDPSDVAPPARRVGLPNVDGSIGGDIRYALPPSRPSRHSFYYGRELQRRVTYDHAAKNDKGHYPRITEEERATHTERQNTALQSDEYWKDELKACHYFPTPEDSPVNFSYRVDSATYVVPYHVVGPMTWEYLYHSGKAQEDLADRLIPASLYGLKVTRPGYRSADAKPATTKEAQAAYDSGRGFLDHVSDTDVNAHAIPVGEVGRGHQGAALYASSWNVRWQRGTSPCSPLQNNGRLTGIPSTWLPLQHSIAWCGAVPSGQALRRMHWICCFATFGTLIQTSMTRADGRI